MTSGGRFVVGLVGGGVGLSLSPPLHEREADELGLRYIYQLVDIDELGLRTDDVGELVTQARRLGFAGLNVTHPCKQTVVKYLDELSADAATLSAVNTVVFTEGRSVGHNTDWSGFSTGFTRGLPGASIRDVLLLGAGGAGAAVAYAMLAMGVGRLTVVDVERDRADRLVAALAGIARGVESDGFDRLIGAEALEDVAERLREADGLINATPVGMTPRLGSPLPLHLLRPDMWVADVVYRPLETELLRYARELGCRTLNGGGMVVFQAAEAFRLFTGRTPDAERMYRHFASLTVAA